MAVIVAAGGGNFSVGATWVGGVVPGVSDTAQSGDFTVTIDTDVECVMIEATGSGHFEVNAACNITAAIRHSGTYTTNGALYLKHAAGTVAIVGAITQNSVTANTHVVVNSSTGTLTINGTVTSGISSSQAIRNNSTGTVVVTGTSVGGSAGGAVGINASGTGNVILNGSTTGGSATNAWGIQNGNSGSVTVNGNATGGSGGGCVGAYNQMAGTMIVTGNATGGSVGAAYGLSNNVAGTVSCNQAIGGSVENAFGLYGRLSTGKSTYKIADNHTGSAALGGYTKMVVDASVNKIIVTRSDTGAAYELSYDYPAAADVKSGVTYLLGTRLGALVGGGSNPLHGKVG